jgi:hypothetical protein
MVRSDGFQVQGEVGLEIREERRRYSADDTPLEDVPGTLDELPVIEMNGTHPRNITEQVRATLIKANAVPRLFVRDGRPVLQDQKVYFLVLRNRL